MFKAFEFCIPTTGTKVPAGQEWLHEIKYDGYRLRLERDGHRVRLITKGGYDWTKRYPWITEAARKVLQKRFVLDGEAVILGVDGISDFYALHSGQHNDEVQFCAFDILVEGDDDLRKQPLHLRKTNLERLLFFGATKGATTTDALTNVRANVNEPRYCLSSDPPVVPPGTAARFYVLGPPHDELLRTCGRNRVRYQRRTSHPPNGTDNARKFGNVAKSYVGKPRSAGIRAQRLHNPTNRGETSRAREAGPRWLVQERGRRTQRRP
jgi:hypothetical protein